LVDLESRFAAEESPDDWPPQALGFIELGGNGTLGVAPLDHPRAGRLIRHWPDSGASVVEPFPDLTALATRWLDLHTSGHYQWDGRAWHGDYSALPIEHRIGVV
jgi:hypothetical protein